MKCQCGHAMSEHAGGCGVFTVGPEGFCGCKAFVPRLTCDVCGAPAIGVAGSALGPVSFAYCQTCANTGAEPYGMTVAFVAETCGTTEEAIAEWFRPVVAATAERAGKTVPEFWAEVAARAARSDR